MKPITLLVATERDIIDSEVSIMLSASEMKMLIQVWRCYSLGDSYDIVVSNLESNHTLKEYVKDENYFKKNGETKTIIYKTEILCPLKSENRIPVLLLFSNPHPRSIISGMFLSPEGDVNRFWLSMQCAEMFKLPNETVIGKGSFPEPIRQIFLNLEYQSHFVFHFYPFFSFPSRNPQELERIFGEYFTSHMINESRWNLLEFVELKSINHIVCFGKQAFQHISTFDEVSLRGYTKTIKKEGFIHSLFNISSQNINLYLTLPTSQGRCKARERIDSLKRIKVEIQKR
ncbi:hypothetical protein ES703_38046 [subsurface metagenome]